MKKLLFRKSTVLVFGGLVFLFWVGTVFASSAPPAINYAPNLWFDSEEQYYPANPLDFYFDENLEEISGEIAKAKYDKLSFEEKLKYFTGFYRIVSQANEWVYQYWFFYIFNNSNYNFGNYRFGNEHYGDFESVFVFVDKNTEKINRIVGSAHTGTEFKWFVPLFMFNNEIINLEISHVTVLVEKGGHANYLDGDGNGLINSRKDLTYRTFRAYPQLTKSVWSEKDKLYGIKVYHDDRVYNLISLSKFKDKFIEKYGIYRDLLVKSPILESFVKTSKKYFSLKEKLGLDSGGKPTRAPWHKSNYHNPDQILPLSSFLTKKIKEGVDFIAEKIEERRDKIREALLALEGQVFGGVFGRKDEESIISETEEFGSLAPKLVIPDLDSTGEGEAYKETELVEELVGGEPEMEMGEVRLLEEAEPLEETFLVERVIDGDTIVLENEQQVRYIGINAPEGPNGCFAQQATEKNRELVGGKEIRLEKDVSETDNYGRLLRYVYVNSLFVNDYLVRNGYAYDWAYGSDIKYKEELAEAEQDAKENREGLWGDVCHPIKPVFHFPHTGGPYRILEQTALASVEASFFIEQEEEEEREDATPPDISISPLVYNYASSSLTVQWSSLEYPSVSFDVEHKQDDGDWQDLLANTSETQTIFLVETKDTTYYFRVKAKDLVSNWSDWQEASIEILSKPVIINEIAWMGTAYRSQDEWIELYNKSNQDIDLTGWSLRGLRSGPDIIFGDKDLIPKQGYYLIERTDDTPTNQPADWYGSFGNGIDNEGETLELRDNQGNLIDSVNDWYAGENRKEGEKWTRKTMERINPEISGTNLKNWRTYLGPGSSIVDGDNNPIFGTPKAENSVYKLYAAVTKHITQDTIWTLENSPYLIYDNGGGSQELLEIAEDTILIIEPGVVVKFVNPGFKIYGTIRAQGTNNEPIVFTNYNDDKYGGDIFGGENDSQFCQENPDDSKCPQPGFWSGIWITSSSSDSVFDNVIIRYAGSRTRPFRTGSTYSFPGAAVGAGIRVEDTSITLKNSIIEHNLFNGVRLTNSSDTVIEDLTFRNHLKYDNSYTTLGKKKGLRNIAIYIDSSSSQIRNSTFQDNLTGIFIVGNNSQPASPADGSIIENNQFSENFYPIWVQNSYPQFSGNQIDGNNWNGIVLKGMQLNQDYTLGGGSVFINYEEIPPWSIVVPTDYTLTIEPGTIIKSVYGTSGLKIEGTLIAEGTASKPIIFTSLYDDEYGGDTNGDENMAEYCRTKDPDDNTYPNCPGAGFWGQIVFTSTSTDSSLNHVVIRYGGKKWGQSYNHRPDYVLKIDSSDLTLSNSIIEDNTAGFHLENSNSRIVSTTFRDHRYSMPFSSFVSTGLRLISSSAIIDLATFLNNKLGLYIDLASLPTLINLIFADNNKDIEDMRPEEPEEEGNIEIIDIFYDGVEDGEADEYVEIKNSGEVAVDLENYTLSDEADHTYTFPTYNFQLNETIKVYTNMGTFSYESGAAIWNNTGDTAYLKDNNGNLIDTYSYQE